MHNCGTTVHEVAIQLPNELTLQDTTLMNAGEREASYPAKIDNIHD